MSRNAWLRGGVTGVLLLGLLVTAEAAPERLPAPRPGTATGPVARPGTRPATGFVPKFEALAETRLLMEGLALPNFKALEEHLKKKPADADTWTFARGQALLVAETGNLLLLRPPRNQGRDTWMKAAMDLRQQASTLARRLGSQDYAGSKAALANLTTSCNRCHETFRVRTRIGPDMEKDAD